jgi:adenosylcobinamide-GDP ribazoletransferase
MKSFLAALRFLTILPIPGRRDDDAVRLGRSVPFFPVVGLLIGLAAATFDSVLTRLFPPLLASGFTVTALLAVSGGLHIDGLADTADGFFSSRPQERILEIMRDSRTGPMGVTAIVCLLILKTAAVASIAPGTRWAAILLMPLAGRCALVVLLAFLPYARSGGGLATAFQNERSVFHGMWAVLVLALVAWITAAFAGLAMAAVAVIGMLVFAAYSYFKIGGYTGDTLGAACEIAEAMPAIVAAAMSLRL